MLIISIASVYSIVSSISILCCNRKARSYYCNLLYYKRLYLSWFNVDKSIIITGNGQYKLKPTIRVVPVDISGAISGQVLPLDADPTIWTLVGADTASTFTDLTGLFKLMALPEGNYNVHITPADTLICRDTTITDVNVLANQITDIGIVTLEER